MSAAPFVFCQYADDIRREVNGKITVVGIYQGAMFVYGSIPQTLPRLTILVNLMLKEPKEVKSLVFRVLWNEELLQTLDLPAEHLIGLSAEPEPSPFGNRMGRGIQAHIFLQPFDVPNEGVLRVVADLDGEIVRGNGLRIQQAPPDAPPLQ